MQLIDKNSKYKKVKRFQGGNIVQRDNTRMASKLAPKLKEESKLPTQNIDNQTFLSPMPNRSAALEEQAKVNAIKNEAYNNLEKTKYANFWTAPYANFNGKTAYDLGTNLVRESTYAAAGEILLPLLGKAVSKGINKLQPKAKRFDTVPKAPTVKEYSELKSPDMRTPEEINTVRDYTISSLPFRLDYSSLDNFYKSFLKNRASRITDINDPKIAGLKRQADAMYKMYKPRKEQLDEIIQRTKGDRFQITRHTNDKVQTGNYTPNRQLSFSFPDIGNKFGKNRIIVDVPEEQSYLATGKAFDTFETENEVLLPSKLKFKIKKLGKNEYGGKDYIGKILNPYLMLPITTTNFINRNNGNN